MAFNSSGASCTFTTNAACTVVGLWYKKGPSQGNLKITVDALTPITIDTGNATTSWGNIWRSDTDGGLTLTSGVHTIKVEAATGGSLNAGYAATVETFMFDPDTLPRTISASRQGNTSGGFTQAVNPGWQKGLETYAADLAMIYLGVNDVVGGVALSTIQTNFQEIITTLNALPTPPGAILLSNLNRISYFANDAAWTAYNAMIDGLVAANANVILFDMNQILGKNTDNGYIQGFGAGVHFNSKAHSVVADTIARLTLPEYSQHFRENNVSGSQTVTGDITSGGKITSGGDINSGGQVVAASTGSFVGGTIAFYNVFNYPVVALRESANTSAQVAILSSSIAAALGGPAGATLSFGDGTVGSVYIGDTFLYRKSAGVLSTNNSKLESSKLYRVGSTTSSATPTINTDAVDIYKLTAQAVDITSFTTNLSGTPSDGQRLEVHIKGTAARAITWGASFASTTVGLPTTTVSTNKLRVLFEWNAVSSVWDCIGVA
jgi:lysophospholipase L1-like esterase